MDVAATTCLSLGTMFSISFGRHAGDRLDLTIKGRILCSRLLQGLQFER